MVATAKSNPNQFFFQPRRIASFHWVLNHLCYKVITDALQNLLVCWCPLWHSRRYRGGKSTPWVPEPTNRTFLPVDWRKLNLFLPDNWCIADTDQLSTLVCILPMSQKLLAGSPGRTPCTPPGLSHPGQLLSLPSCPRFHRHPSQHKLQT